MATEIDVDEALSNELAKKASLDDKKDASELDADETPSNELAKEASLDDKKDASELDVEEKLSNQLADKPSTEEKKDDDVLIPDTKSSEEIPSASNVNIEKEPPKINTIEVIDWTKIIAENEYISKKQDSAKDEHSFCTLVDKPLTQSQNIMLGSCMENLFYDTIRKTKISMQDMSGRGEGKQKKGEKQKDHIWLDVEKREIIYAEQKNNINLDTEKSVSTEKKVAEIANKYPDYKITPLILAARYLSSVEPIAEKIIARKYKNTQVIGVNEYLALFGLPGFANYDEYKAVIKAVVQMKFKE